jgi:hypothetical protein
VAEISIPVPFTGGCACGAIRYESTVAPVMMFKCHCRDCQKVTGGAFVPGLLIPASAFRLTKGELRYNFTPSLAGGRHKRGYWPECGSRITGGQSDQEPNDFIGLTAGSLDDSSWFRPQMDFFVSDAQPWDQMDPAIPKYKHYPPAPA